MSKSPTSSDTTAARAASGSEIGSVMSVFMDEEHVSGFASQAEQALIPQPRHAVPGWAAIERANSTIAYALRKEFAHTGQRQAVAECAIHLKAEFGDQAKQFRASFRDGGKLAASQFRAEGFVAADEMGDEMFSIGTLH